MDKASSAGRGNREDKARSASGHKGKGDTKAPQRSKDDHKATQPSSTSGDPPVKGMDKDGNKAPQPSSSVDNTNDCAAGTKEDSLPSLIKIILEEAMSDAGKKVEDITDEFLDSQIEHISQLIETTKNPQKPDANPNSLVLKINKSFSERMTPPKSGWKWPHKLPEIGQIRTTAVQLLEILGNSQPAYFASLLFVAHVLRRFDMVSHDPDECRELLKEIYKLAKFVIHLKSKFSRPNKGMAELIQESRQLILHGSILCCTILKSSFISKLFKASANKDQLAKLKGEVVHARNQLRQMAVSSDTQEGVKYLVDRERVRGSRNVQDMMQELYPSHAVGIDVQLNKVIELLEWKSETKTVAVIVHGIPGMGKTTLADAVFSTIFQQNYTSTNICKYSRIRLCEDKESSLSPITTLQTNIRDDLVDHDDQRVAAIRTYEDGQRKIGSILKKKSVFLCIDNVLNKERLEQLLPLGSTLDKAKKLRLLITARDRGIGTVLGHNMSPKFYQVSYSSPSQAEEILKKHMDTQKLDKTVVDDIVQTSGGVPLILRVIGQFIGAEEDKQRAWRIFREERESWSGEIFDRIDIAYRHLPDDLKDPFLDICSFFNSGWYWEAVEDIVGTSILDRLQKKGLLTKDRNSTVTIHDVILRIGLKRAKGSRIMDANGISQSDGKVIKGLWFTKDRGLKPISAIKLDQIASSLRILALQNLKVEGDYNENFPELIYLDAGVNPLPSNVSAFEKLTYLSYSPQDPEDLNLSQMPFAMKRLKLYGKLYSDKFRSCSLRLHGLPKLRVLKLFEFKHLTKLPKEFASLKCLQVLQIIDCDGFEELPTDLGELNEMSSLTIEKCPKLRKLPQSISKLSSLSWLYLSSCKKLEDLSKDFHRLPKLQYLTLSSCPMLQGQWMDVIKKVKTIKEVDIRKSEKLLQKWQGITDPPRTFSVKVN